MPNLVYASNTASKSDACQGVSIISGNSSCDSLKSSQSSLSSILGLVLNLLSVIVGLVAVIMIIIGGLKYVTSSGNSERTNEAKNTILYAIIGLVIVAIAQIIVRFVIHKA
jgi:ABC-type Fe3+ transport system permease subunit